MVGRRRECCNNCMIIRYSCRSKYICLIGQFRFWVFVADSSLQDISIVCEQIVQISSLCDIDTLVNQYQNSLHNILNLQAPRRTIIMKGSPWCITQIDEARTKRCKCETFCRHKRTENHCQIAARNKGTNLIANTKITYFQMNLEAVDFKSMFTRIKSLKGRETKLLPTFYSKIESATHLQIFSIQN